MAWGGVTGPARPEWNVTLMQASAGMTGGPVRRLATMVFALFMGALFGVLSATVAAQGTAHIDASILARSNSPKAGTTTRTAFRQVPRSGWQCSCINPVDIGPPGDAQGNGPERVTAGRAAPPQQPLP